MAPEEEERTPPASEEVRLRQEEYDLRLELNRLQRQLLEDTASDALEARLEEIAVLQARLNEIEPQLAKLAAAAAASTARKVNKARSRVTVKPGMEYIPTGIYHLLDQEELPLVLCEVDKKGSGKEQPVLRIRAYIEGYSDQAVEVVELGLRASEVRLSPTLQPQMLHNLTELTPATLHVVIDDVEHDKLLEHLTYRVWLLARNSAQTAVKDLTSGNVKDLSRFLGAYVTPNTPSIMRFLRQVAEHHPRKRLAGYQPDEPVEEQVQAIFQALKEESKITYVNSLVDFNPQEGTKSQRIRLPRESLEEGQANCIDGTVLFASLLEAISLSPAIVLVPKHAFVGWETGKNSGRWNYLETTQIGSHDFADAVDFATRLANVYEKQRDTTGDDAWFRRWPLRELRAEYQIWPME